MSTDSSNTEAATSKAQNPFFQIFILTIATFMATLDATVASSVDIQVAIVRIKIWKYGFCALDVAASVFEESVFIKI